MKEKGGVCKLRRRLYDESQLNRLAYVQILEGKSGKQNREIVELERTEMQREKSNKNKMRTVGTRRK